MIINNDVTKKVLTGALLIVMGCMIMMSMTSVAFANKNYHNYYNPSVSTDLETATSNLVDIVVKALIALFFAGGAASAGMGIFAVMNKDSNPQAAHGAWKKIAGGAIAMMFSLAMGVLSNTIINAVQ